MPFKPIQINTTSKPSSSGFKPISDVSSIINNYYAQQSFGQRVKQDIQQRGKNVVNEINNANQNPYLSGLKATAEGFGAISDVVGEAFNSVAPDLSKKVTDVASKGFNSVVNKLADTSLIKGAAQGDTSNLETGLGIAKGYGDIANNILAAKGVSDTANQAFKIGKELGKPSTIGVLPETVPAESEMGFYQKQALNDWKQPIESNQAGFKKTSAIYDNATSRGTDIPKTLVDNKIFLADNIQDGKYLTSDSADILRTNAGEASKTYLRPALEIADYSTPTTPIRDIVKEAINNVKNDKFIPIESKNTLIDRITKLEPELEAQYPNGMTLTNQLDEKILRDLNAKYSPVGDVATNLEAQKNKAIADALRGSLENKAPEGVPVKEFNNELSKLYQSADYLDSINGKKVPRSLTQKLAQTTAKVVGAVTGESLGGGILGGVGGYHLGGILENYFANMANPFKAQFLEQLQKVSPEAFNTIKEYIGSKELNAIMTPKLPAGSPLGTPENPILAPEKTRTSSVEVVPAEKNPTTINPKTGKFQRTYRSSSGSVKNPSTSIKTNVPKKPISPKSTTSSLKVKGEIPKQLEPLAQEAQKYKSADFNPSTSYLKRNIEVLNKNGIKVKNPDEVITLYHGTNETGVKGITESGSLKPSSFLATDPNASKGFVFGKGGKVLKIKVRVKDLGFVHDGGMAGSKGVSVQTIDKLVKGKDGIYKAEISK